MAAPLPHRLSWPRRRASSKPQGITRLEVVPIVVGVTGSPDPHAKERVKGAAGKGEGCGRPKAALSVGQGLSHIEGRLRSQAARVRGTPMQKEARKDGSSPAPVLTVENVSYWYGAKRALDDVSFKVYPGRVTALLGPNGAGKSTLFSLITRLFDAPEGRIRDLRQVGGRVGCEGACAARRGVPAADARSRSHGQTEFALLRRAQGIAAERRRPTHGCGA